MSTHPPIRDLSQTLARRRAFYGRQAHGGILVVFDLAGARGESHLRYIPDAEGMLAANLRYFAARAGLDDDWVPVAQSHLGMGLFGAIYGSPIVWMPEDETSWSEPPLSEWPSLDALHKLLTFDPASPMIDLARRTVRHYARQARGHFGVGMLETVDALNLVVALRGATNAYRDLYERPEEVQLVMELGLEWNTRWLEMLWQEAGPFANGWCTIGDWLPAKTVWLSVDADTYCQPEVYAGLSRPYMQRLVDRFGAGWQHLHAPGVRLLPEIVKLRGLVGIQIGDDLNYPRTFDRLPEIQAITGDIPLQIGCGWDEFVAGLEAGTLPGGVEYHVHGTPGVAEANEAAARARHYGCDHADNRNEPLWGDA